MKKTLILFAHPNFNKSRINKALLEFIPELDNVTFRNLYDVYQSDIKNINIKDEQSLLLSHERIIFHFPFYWYSTPAMLKEWLDTVLEHGFAYGSNGNELSGKEFKVVTSTGGSITAYQHSGQNNFTIDELLRPLELTCNLTHMVYTTPFITYGALSITEDELRQKAKEYKEMLQMRIWS